MRGLYVIEWGKAARIDNKRVVEFENGSLFRVFDSEREAAQWGYEKSSAGYHVASWQLN